MRRSFQVVLVVAAAGLVLGGAAFWWLAQQPLYRPGMVRAERQLRAPLSPPDQPPGADAWRVEPDIRLAHFAVGTGRSALVIHGGPGVPFRQPMQGLAPLTGAYRFHYYDQRGCGDSTRPIDRFESRNTYRNLTALDRTLGLGAQVADVERIRRILGEEKLVLIGHSWGGFLAALYAAEFPEHVEALVLVSPATTLVMPTPQGEPELFASMKARLPEDRRAEFEAFLADYLDFGKLFTRSERELVALNERMGGYYLAAVNRPVPAPGPLGGWMVWAMYASMGRRHDYRAALRPVTAPVLVLAGADDLQSLSATRAYAELFPHARFAVIEGASHFAFEEQPERFAAEVGAFLQGR